MQEDGIYYDGKTEACTPMLRLHVTHTPHLYKLINSVKKGIRNLIFYSFMPSFDEKIVPLPIAKKNQWILSSS